MQRWESRTFDEFAGFYRNRDVRVWFFVVEDDCYFCNTASLATLMTKFSTSVIGSRF